MAQVSIILKKNEKLGEVRSRLCKALSDDNILVATERYNDQLMEDLVSESEDYFAKLFLNMTKDIVRALKEE